MRAGVAVCFRELLLDEEALTWCCCDDVFSNPRRIVMEEEKFMLDDCVDTRYVLDVVCGVAD